MRSIMSSVYITCGEYVTYGGMTCMSSDHRRIGLGWDGAQTADANAPHSVSDHKLGTRGEIEPHRCWLRISDHAPVLCSQCVRSSYFPPPSRPLASAALRLVARDARSQQCLLPLPTPPGALTALVSFLLLWANGPHAMGRTREAVSIQLVHVV
ncbi:hypothetical protein BX600DRAFT_25980 [Xylariales sp. PMI_506]|nr:hypothetical protein BX600DRAFT_25980 [Xylariales sp. PMI_506]